MGRCIDVSDGILWSRRTRRTRVHQVLQEPVSHSLISPQLKERVNIIPKTGHFKFSPSLVQYRFRVKEFA